MKYKISFATVTMSLILSLAGCTAPEVRKPVVPSEETNESNLSAAAIQPETEPVKTVRPVEKKEPTSKKSHPSAKAVPIKPPTEEFDPEDLNRKVSMNQTAAVRKVLQTNPAAFESIRDEKKKLLYVGPSGWRVIDVIERLRNRKISQKGAIEHIKNAKQSYRVFTYEEIQFLLEHKLPYKVINTMMTISK